MSSKGLRSTRTTARHRVVSDGGTTVVLAPVILWKTHLAAGQRNSDIAPRAQYSATGNRRSSASSREHCLSWYGDEDNSGQSQRSHTTLRCPPA